jgi:hypothetical protein
MKRRSSRRAFCRRSNSTNRQSASFLSEPIFCPELRCIPIQDNPGRAVRAILPQHDSRSSRPAPDTGDRGKRVIPTCSRAEEMSQTCARVERQCVPVGEATGQAGPGSWHTLGGWSVVAWLMSSSVPGLGDRIGS